MDNDVNAFSSPSRGKEMEGSSEEGSVIGGNLPISIKISEDLFPDDDPLGADPLEGKSPSDMIGDRPSAAPVTGKGRMIAGYGFQPENHEWLEVLCDGEAGIAAMQAGNPLRGRDPLSIPPEVLTAAGHPNRSTKTLKAAMCKPTNGGAYHDEGMAGALSDVVAYRDIHGWCLSCASDERPSRKAVRSCAIINCPFWAYRLGKNPHRPKLSAEARAMATANLRREAAE